MGGDNFGNLGSFGIDFERADCHPSDDRPCTTTHNKGHGLSTRGAGRPYIYILHLPSYTIGCVLYKAFGVFRRLDTILPL